MTEVNTALSEEPQTVNDAPEAGGWFVKLKVTDPKALDALMDRAAYEAYLKTL